MLEFWILFQSYWKFSAVDKQLLFLNYCKTRLTSGKLVIQTAMRVTSRVENKLSTQRKNGGQKFISGAKKRLSEILVMWLIQ